MSTSGHFAFLLAMLLVYRSAECFGRGLSRSPAALSQQRARGATFKSVSLGLHMGTSIDCTQDALNLRVRSALVKVYGNEVGGGADTMLLPGKADFGDYQCNAALPLAKKLKLKPQEVADKLMNAMDVADIVDRMDVSGPGFINLHLSDSFVRGKVASMLNDPERVGIPRATAPQRIIVDFSSPNIAKEMHVGHLRSTIIGDSLSKILSFLGHDVLRLNHVGDWGTQFGMLIHYLNVNKKENTVEIGDLVQFYKAAKKKFDEDLQFQECARNEVVKLQAGDPQSIQAWKTICDVSRVEFQKIYNILNVKVEERGESFYNPFLPSVVSYLEKEGFAVQSDGATCIFVDGYKNPDGTPQPMIIKKSDGGFLYATTDLAAARHRSRDEKADRVLYVTDVGQSQHFQMVFDAARKSKLVSDTTELVHVPFGLVQGEDGKKFKTRAGDTIKLIDLLDEAVRICSEEMLARAGKADLSVEDERAARVVGVGAVKYADLSMNRESNYRFSYKKMLALNGNTAPYMLYAYVRIQGIRRKAAAELLTKGIDLGETKNIRSEDIIVAMKEEKLLAKQIIKLDEVLLDVERTLYPNKMCDYLFELSQKFNQFYENCPVINAENIETQRSRAALCALTADTLKLGLDLLGIDTIEKL